MMNVNSHLCASWLSCYQARVMRDLRHVDAQGRGTSKEFGFVSFMQHHDALVTLRTLNNNPDIFTRQRVSLMQY